MSSKYVDTTAILQVIGSVYETPQLLDYTEKYCIMVDSGVISSCTFRTTQFILAFPTKDIRDMFVENFRDLIEKGHN